MARITVAKQLQAKRLGVTPQVIAAKEKEQREKLEALRQQAIKLQQEKFVDKPVDVQYQEVVPSKWVGRGGNVSPDWYKLSPAQRDYYIRKYSAKGRGYTKSFTRTKTEIDPFTFEEYKQEYKKLGSGLKQFFESPKDITSRRQAAEMKRRSVITAQIQQREKKVEEFKAKRRAAAQRGDRGRKNYWDDRIAEMNDQIGGLVYARGQGLQLGAALSYAADKASAAQERTRLIREEKKIKKVEVSPKVYAKLDKEGAIKEGLFGGKRLIPVDLTTGKAVKEVLFLPKGEDALYNKYGKIESIKSGVLGETVPYKEYNEATAQKLAEMSAGLNIGEPEFSVIGPRDDRKTDSFLTGAAGGFLENPLTKLKGWLGLSTGGKTQTEIQREALTPVASSGNLTQGTISYVLPTSSDLSQEAQIYKKQFEELQPTLISTEAALDVERERVYDIIKGGGITEQEAEAANVYLSKFGKFKGKEFEATARKRGKEITKEVELAGEWKFLSGLPEWKGDPIETARGRYEKLSYLPEKARLGLSTWSVVPGEVGKGIYEGIRLKPKKFATSTAISVGIVGATAALGPVAGAAGYGAALPAIGTGLKVAGYGAGLLYGTSVVSRVGGQKDLFGAARTAGEITGTELLPMAIGFGGTRYAIRRGSLTFDKYEVLAGKSELLKGYKFSKSELAQIKKEFKLSKALAKQQPPVKELDFTGMKRIPVKVRKITLDFIKTYKRKLITGGSLGGQKTQALTPMRRPPGDVDFFVEGLMPARTAASLNKKLGLLWRKAGVNVKIGKTSLKVAGKKAVEFHPYKSFLRPNIEQVTPWYRTARAGITKTPSGIRVLRIGTQGQQKVLGYARYGPPRAKDILDWRFTIKPTLLKQVQSKVTVKEVPFISKGIGGMAQTRIGVGGINRRILIRSGLPPTIKEQVLQHELVHIAKPWWSEKAVGKATIMSADISKKGYFVESLKAPPYTGASNYVSYAPYASSTTATFAPFIYQGFRGPRAVPAPYAPVITPKSTFLPSMFRRKSPYTKQGIGGTVLPRGYSPYKSTMFPTLIPPPIFRRDPIIPSTKPGRRGAYFKLPRVGEKGLKRSRRIVQPVKYTPSISASILEVRAKKKPGKILGGGYFVGWRPVISNTPTRKFGGMLKANI